MVHLKIMYEGTVCLKVELPPLPSDYSQFSFFVQTEHHPPASVKIEDDPEQDESGYLVSSMVDTMNYSS